MQIGGLVKNSFVDFPNKISAVVFTPTCNFRCWYCHNSHLFYKEDLLDENEVLEFLRERTKFLDGVTVSGGEPTLQDDLKEFIAKLKGMGYLVKLDTNGTNPEVLQELIDEHLVDYVAMDIKAPFDKYDKIVGVNTLIHKVKNSVDILLEGKVDYEFRTTFASNLTLDDIEEIAKSIKGAKRFSIQRYRFVEYNKTNMPLKPKEEHFLARDIAKKYVDEVTLKGVD